MKKLCILLISLCLCVVPVKANETVKFYLFYGDGCPHCAHEKEWLEEIKSSYPEVEFSYFETWYDEANQALYHQVKNAYQISSNGVPLTIIGDKYFVGFNDYTKEQIKQELNRCLKESCSDTVAKLQQGQEVTVIKPEEVVPTTETKIQVETKKVFLNNSVYLVLGVALMAVIGSTGFIMLKKKKKSLD